MTRYTSGWMCAVFLGGCVLSDWVSDLVPPSALWGVSLAGAAVALVLVARRSGPKVRRTALAVGILGLAMLQTAYRAVDYADLRPLAASLTEVTGTIVSYPSYSETSVRFIFRPDYISADIRVTCWMTEGTTVRITYGDRLRITGRSRVPEAFDGFDYPSYLAGQGIFALMSVEADAVEFLGQGGSVILRTGDRLRQSILGRLRSGMTAAQYGLAQSLLFGDRAALDAEVEAGFSRLGTMHLLAVSGLHLGILLAGVWWGVRRLNVRPAIAYPIVLATALLILWIVGPRTSLVRATTLFAFLALGSVLADLGWILRKTVRPLNGLAVAAVCLVAARPGTLHESGFQLSFTATAAILVAMTPAFGLGEWIERASGNFGRWRRWVHPVLGLVAISAAAQAGTAPVVAAFFGTFHPLALLANLLLVPLAALCLWAGLFAAAANAVGVGWITRVFGWGLSGMIGISRVAARLPGSELLVPGWMAWWLGALVLFVYGAIYVRSLSRTSKSTSITSDGPVGASEGRVGRAIR